MDINKEYSCFERNCVVYQKNIDNEADYQEALPEYCDDVFKVAKCEVRNYITSVNVALNEVKMYGKVEICLTYYNENSNLCYADFDEEFEKTVEVDSIKTDSAFACAICVDKYAGFRVINQRRIDIHSLSTISLSVYDKVTCQNIKSCENSKLRVERVKLANIFDSSINKCEFDEDIALPADLPEIKRIISSSSFVTLGETKIIQDKALIKGTVNLSVLYTSSEDEKICKCDYSFDVSKIVVCVGLSENDIVSVRLSVGGLYFKLKSSQDNSISHIEAYGDIIISTVFVKEGMCDIVTDGYIPRTKCNCSYSNIMCNYGGAALNNTFKENLSFEFQNKLGEIKEVNVRLSDVCCKKGILEITAFVSVLSINDGVLCSYSESNQFQIDAPGFSQAVCGANIISYDYSLKSDNCIELRLMLNVIGCSFNTVNKNILSEITPTDKIANSHEMSIYFAKQGEEVWNIAKSFSSDIDLIKRDNDLSGDVIENNSVLLILGV